MSVYEQDPGSVVRWRRYTADSVEVFVDPRGKAEVRYVDQDGELLSDEALKAPDHDLRRRVRTETLEECFRFIEEEANVADRKADLGGALTLRRTLKRMKEGLGR